MRQKPDQPLLEVVVPGIVLLHLAQNRDRLADKPILLVQDGGAGKLVQPLDDLPLLHQEDAELLAGLRVVRRRLDLPGQGNPVLLLLRREHFLEGIEESHLQGLFFSRKFVESLASTKSELTIIFLWNATVVRTPSIRTSSSALRIRMIASFRSSPCTISFPRRES